MTSSVRNFVLICGLCALVTLGSAEAQIVAADSIFGGIPSPHSPRGALRRSAALPGWGQIYNKQYIKLPFLYAALGGLIYTAVVKHDDYILYRKAFQYKAFQEQVDSGNLTENPKIGFKSSYDEIAKEFGSVSSRPLENQRNNLRRSRDLSLIGIGLVYSLAMLDAFVSAHLLDFDVGEDLTFQVAPQPGGLRLSARIQIGSSGGGGLSNR